jgi:hypothetical protein
VCHLFGGARRGDDVDEEVLDDAGDVDLVHRALCLLEFVESDDLLDFVRAESRLAIEAVNDPTFVLSVQKVHLVAELETVTLCLGEFVHALHLDGVLRRDDHERRRQAERLAADRHLPLLHRL